MLETLKRLFVGRPLASTQMEEQRLTKKIALAVFSSDALSSTAYATEEILFVVAVGASSLALGLSKLVPIAIVVAGLLAIVIVSYRQVIFAYPNGGGAYVVSKENIGEMPSLVAAAVADGRLRADRGGVDLRRRRRDHLHPRIQQPGDASSGARHRSDRAHHAAEHARDQGVGTDLRHTYVPVHADLRRADRATACTVPSPATSARFPTTPNSPRPRARSAARLTLFLLLKGFSSGAVALTGIEAISNGVPAFRRPESKNAAATLVWMGVLLGTLFLGISILAHRLAPFPSHDRTVIAQLGLQVFGNGAVFVFLQFATAAILVLAANTAYNGFPSLSSIIAFDGYLPRQLMNRGDRLVFSNGIIFLAGAAALLLRRIRWDHERAHPALCRGGVHVVHPLAVRDGATSHQTARASLEAQCGAERRRRDRDA